MLNDCLSSWCQTLTTAEATVCRGKKQKRCSGACAERETVSACVHASTGRRDAEEVESHCSPAYQLKLEQILCVQKIRIQVKFNPSYHSNPCQSLSQAARLTDLHFQHQGEHHNVLLGEEHTQKNFHTEQIRRKLLADDLWWQWPASLWWQMLFLEAE